MQHQLLPLFPLEVVLFPNTPLPLHIFEPRYKEMIGEAMRAKSEFGIVQAREKGIMNTGCTAIVERVISRYDDGRLDIIAMGRRRFEILSLNDEKEYLRGEVDFFDDEDDLTAPEPMQQKAIDEINALSEVEEIQLIGEPHAGDHNLSFQLAQLIPDLTFKQLLLATRSEAERIRKLVEFLPTFIVKQKYVAHMKRIVPKNGHGKQQAGPHNE